MGAGTPFPSHPLHPCWMPLPSAEEGEAAGSLAEFSPRCEHGQHPCKQRRSPPAASPLLQTLVRRPRSRNRGSLGSTLLLSTPREHPLPSLPPSAACPGAGSGITCREECGSPGRNKLVGVGFAPWGVPAAWGTPNSGRKHWQLLQNTLIPAAAGNEREPRPGEQLAASLQDYCSPELRD